MFLWKGICYIIFYLLYLFILKNPYDEFTNIKYLICRCNDVLELVQTMRHFQILAKTVSIGGADNPSMDVITQEVHAKYQNALQEFQRNVTDVMNLENKSEKFETCFYHLRTTIKVS